MMYVYPKWLGKPVPVTNPVWKASVGFSVMRAGYGVLAGPQNVTARDVGRTQGGEAYYKGCGSSRVEGA